MRALIEGKGNASCHTQVHILFEVFSSNYRKDIKHLWNLNNSFWIWITRARYSLETLYKIYQNTKLILRIFIPWTMEIHLCVWIKDTQTLFLLLLTYLRAAISLNMYSFSIPLNYCFLRVFRTCKNMLFLFCKILKIVNCKFLSFFINKT